MARKSIIARNEKRKKLVEKYAAKREELKAAGDYQALSQLPRDSSATRLRTRCVLTGRGRGNYRKFGPDVPQVCSGRKASRCQKSKLVSAPAEIKRKMSVHLRM